jgi:hypothetical protein
MQLHSIVQANKQVIDFVNNWPDKEQPFHIKQNLLLTKYIGTLDVATSRFNTILLRLSEHPIMQSDFENSVLDCQNVIHKFYINTCRLTQWPKFTQSYLKWRLHRLGTRQIPKIKKTLNIVLTTIDGTH